MKTKRWVVFILLMLSLLLSSCNTDKGKPLPLDDYRDALGRFTFATPTSWQINSTEDLLTLTPPDYSGQEGELRVMLFTSATLQADCQAHIDEAQDLLAPFLSQYLDEAYQVVNEGETRVDKRSAMLLDFAKPWKGSYLLGRVVIVAMPGYVVAFLGMGDEARWEAFLPSFRAMIKQFHLETIYPATPEA